MAQSKPKQSRRIPRHVVQDFTWILATATDAGLPIVQALDMLREMEKHPAFKRVITDLEEDVASGKTPSQAMEKHPEAFDPLYVQLVAAGEVGGRLDRIFARLGKHLVATSKLDAVMRARPRLREEALYLRFAGTLGLLLTSGVPILDALDIVAALLPKQHRKAVLFARQKVSEGSGTLAKPLRETQVFPELVCALIDIGEQTGAMDQMLLRIAEHYGRQLGIG